MILIADDHADSRQIAREILELAGHTVVEAKDGAEAILLARFHNPELLLLDLRMPEVDGWSVARTLRRNPSTARTTIIAYSACVRTSDREHAIAAGCDGFIVKPIPPRDLLAAVGGWLMDPPRRRSHRDSTAAAG